MKQCLFVKYRDTSSKFILIRTAKMIKCFSFTINITLQNATRDYLNSREGYSLNVCSEKMDLSL